MTFDTVHPSLARALAEQGYSEPTPVQAAVLESGGDGRDLLVSPQTGSGKTVAYGLALAPTILGDAERLGRPGAPPARVGEAHGDIEYRAMRVAPNEIEHAVVNTLRFFESGGALVFCSTREAVRHLHAALRERGFDAVSLSGEMSQRERTDALQALR